MLAVPPLRSACKDNGRDEREMEGFPIIETDIDFGDFNSDNLLDSIDFGDLFIGLEDGDILPDLELDPETLAEFSVSGSGGDGGSAGEDFSEVIKASLSVEDFEKSLRREEEEKVPHSSSFGSGSSCEEEIPSKRRGESTSVNTSLPKKAEKSRKSSSQSKNSHGKRKVKVDWTPELHRRFVQAVEQLGVDKAVPSRILELMGIDCLTRHNIASHLQKYRSHRKHLLAREAEAASWTHRRQLCNAASVGGGKRVTMSPWLAPTMGFPPIAPMHPFRPLHVWGHPTVDHSVMHMWPNKHVAPSPPPPTWTAPPPPPPDPSYWHPHPHHRYGGAPPFAGIPPPHHAMYRSVVDPPSFGPAPPPKNAHAHLLDFQPSKESIDAAIGDALSKPWQPLPLGLKPPAMDSVLGELQRQGIAKIPPATTASG